VLRWTEVVARLREHDKLTINLKGLDMITGQARIGTYCLANL